MTVGKVLSDGAELLLGANEGRLERLGSEEPVTVGNVLSDGAELLLGAKEGLIELVG